MASLQSLPGQNDILQLYEGSHNYRDLTTEALRYFDRSFEDLSARQQQASRAFISFFQRNDVQANIENVPVAQFETIIETVGEMLFMGGLQGVKFRWFDGDDRAMIPNAIAVAMPISGGGYEIKVNTADKVWQQTPIHLRWTLLRQSILHESTHTFYQRYATARHAKLGHHSGWQILSEAIERRMRSEWQVTVDLHRWSSFHGELLASGETDMTPSEIQKCFPDKCVTGNNSFIIDCYPNMPMCPRTAVFEWHDRANDRLVLRIVFYSRRPALYPMFVRNTGNGGLVSGV